MNRTRKSSGGDGGGVWMARMAGALLAAGAVLALWVAEPDVFYMQGAGAQASIVWAAEPSSSGPEEIPIQNGQPGFWSTYSEYLVGGLVVAAAEAVLIVWLAFLLRRQRRLRKESLRATERFEGLFQMAPVPMAHSSMSGRILNLNRQFTAVTGYTIEDIPTTNEWFLRAYPDPKYRHEVIQLWEKSLEGGDSTRPREYEVTCRDGSVRSMEIVARRLGDELVVCFIDTSERHQAAEALKLNAERVQALLKLNQMTDASLQQITDFALETGVRLTASEMGYLAFLSEDETVLTMHSWSKQAMAQCAIMDKPIHYVVKETGLWGEAVRQRRAVITNDYAAPNPLKKGYPDGHVPVRRHMNVPVFVGQRIVLVAGVGNKKNEYDEDDVQQLSLLMEGMWRLIERLRAQEEKEKLQAQLMQAQKMESVGRLAGGVAHDFNNMLGVILGHTELALEQLDPAQPLFADLKEIEKAASRSADLTRQLLGFARRQTVAPKLINLNETVEKTLKMLRRLIGEDIDLIWLPGRSVGAVMMDPSQIDQILANLCVNARDAIRGTGTVTIETGTAVFDEAYCADHTGFQPGGYTLLAVSDNGSGMSKEALENLFEPFFTTKEVGKGTGLGLAMTYGIVKQNNGFVNVYSEPEHGTTFRIYLPCHKEETGVVEDAAHVQPARGGQETVLLVEDEPGILRMTVKMLESLGYTVLAASTPGEAIHAAEVYPGRIHLLITDVVMPEMSGRDLTGKVLSLQPSIKCLFMSGYTADIIAHRGVLEDGVRFIQKPFTKSDLAARVRETLEHGQ